MNKSGIGVGSASIMLVFAVLCLTIFSLITYVVAENDRALVDARVSLVTGYYGADYAAESIIANILAAETIPEQIEGIDIRHGWDEDRGAETTYFSHPINDTKSLFVNLVITGNSYEILSWKMYDTDEWEYDGSINLWTGVDD